MRCSALLGRLQTVLFSRWKVVAVALLTILLTAPAVNRGFKIDDFIHRDLQLGAGARSGLLETMRGFFAFDTLETAHSGHATAPWMQDYLLSNAYSDTSTTKTVLWASCLQVLESVKRLCAH